MKPRALKRAIVKFVRTIRTPPRIWFEVSVVPKSMMSARQQMMVCKYIIGATLPAFSYM